MKENKRGRWEWGMAAIIAAACAYLAIWWGGLNQDEGWYLYAAKLVGEGQLPYRDFFFTQGPTMPYVYSLLPIGGLLSGRLFTYAFSLFGTLVAIALTLQLVPQDKRKTAAITTFALLGCNLYHAYFTAIPKTYALGALFVMIGFLLYARGGILGFMAAGTAFAFASGTRISLILILGVAGLVLLASRPKSWNWIAFGIGGLIGLALTYGFAAADDSSRAGLLAAQAYHAGRGGFDPFFALGSLSRLARGYAATGAVMFVSICAGWGRLRPPRVLENQEVTLWAMGLSFAAVLGLQLSAPYPYDDYQVPIMPILVVLITVWYSRKCKGMWLPVLLAGLAAFSSPLVQEWMTNGQDRFWTMKKGASELATLRETAREVNALDPNGTTMLTQDLYLAVECGRKVPEGMAMGPFSYFAGLDTKTAAARHVLNEELMVARLNEGSCEIAAVSGYGFAIEVPKGNETAAETQAKYRAMLDAKYETVLEKENFGQNHTTLKVMRKRK